MRRTPFVSVLASLLLAAFLGCAKKEAPQVETKAETRSTNPDGSRTTTTTESKQVGSTMAATTETKESGEGGKGKTVGETVVGTVTEYGPGKRIVILTGDGKKHDFDLADKKTTSTVDPHVAVGSKVQLDSTKDDSGNRTLNVVIVAGQ